MNINIFLQRLLDNLVTTRDNTTEATCETLKDELKKIQQINLKKQLHKQKQQMQQYTTKLPETIRL